MDVLLLRGLCYFGGEYFFWEGSILATRHPVPLPLPRGSFEPGCLLLPPRGGREAGMPAVPLVRWNLYGLWFSEATVPLLLPAPPSFRINVCPFPRNPEAPNWLHWMINHPNKTKPPTLFWGRRKIIIFSAE